MTPDPGTLKIIVGWLANLAKLTRHKQGRLTPEDLADLKDERALYATMLAKDLPSGAFTADSLHAVAQGNAFFPAYDEIRSTVQAWWNDHRPHSAPRLSGPDDAPGLSVMDASWLAHYRRRRVEIEDAPGYVAMDRRASPHAFVCTDMGRLESLIRRHSPAAWAVIVGKPPPAEPDPRSFDRKPEQDQANLPDGFKRVASTVAQALDAAALDDKLRAWSVSRQLAVLPTPEPPAPVRASHASGERLDAMRKAAASAITARVAAMPEPSAPVPAEPEPEPVTAGDLPWR